jgi:hypothetical protein
MCDSDGDNDRDQRINVVMDKYPNLHANAIPNFTLPAHEYASKLKSIFRCAGYDIHNAAVSKYYAPVLLSRLPSDISRFIPQEPDLEKILDVLTHLDKKRTSTDQILRRAEHQLKPSLRKQVIVNKLEVNLQNCDGNHEVIEKLAWESIASTLPATMQTMMAILDIVEFPNAAQYEQIDKIWETCTKTAQLCILNQDQSEQSDMVQRSEITDADVSEGIRAIPELGV